MIRTSLAILVITTHACLIVPGGATAGEVPREPLDKVWEEAMLAGNSLFLLNERSVPITSRTRPEVAGGSPIGAASTTRGITVDDTRGTALFGLLGWGGGWNLIGGLLGQAEGPASMLELYGRWVRRIYPGFFETYGLKEEESYDFFLIQRRSSRSRADLIKKWTIEPKEIKWFVAEHVVKGPFGTDERHLKQNETSDVRGFVKYLPESQEAEVTITGLTHPFVERVKVILN